MSKFSVGDITIFSGGVIGRVKAWRGGNVAPYVIEVLESTCEIYKVGETTYESGRDMELKERIEMSLEVELGDYVRDTINGYKGVVFGIEPDGGKVFIHFKRTNTDLYGNRFNNQTNRINAKNIEILSKVDCPTPKIIPQSRLALERKLDLLLEHLALEIVTEPAHMSVQVVEMGEAVSSSGESKTEGELTP